MDTISGIGVNGSAAARSARRRWMIRVFTHRLIRITQITGFLYRYTFSKPLHDIEYVHINLLADIVTRTLLFPLTIPDWCTTHFSADNYSGVRKTLLQDFIVQALPDTEHARTKQGI